MKRWVLSNEILELYDEIQRVPAGVEEIFASIVEGSPPWPDLLPGRSGAAAELQFCRYPIELRAVLAEASDGGDHRVTFEARTQQGVRFPVSANVVERGHVVHDGMWYPVTPGDGEAVISVLHEAGIDPTSGRCSTLRSLLTIRKAAAQGAPVVDGLSDAAVYRQLCRSESRGRPKGVLATLFPYQVDGWHWLSFITREGLGGLLGDEMGLGKTLQVISTVRDPGAQGLAEHTLVVAPGSLLENWVREITKFCPDLTVCKHHGAMRTGFPADLKLFNIVITSYDTAVRDLSLLKMVNWDVVVLDEAQYIRNPEALRTRSVKQIGGRVSLAVTGTPVENSLRDLWSIMDFALPGYLGTLADFETRYGDDEESAASLERLISPLLLRRRIADHAEDLPKRIDIVETLQLSDEEALAYEEVRVNVVREYGAAATLVCLTKLRQFCAYAEMGAADEWARLGEFTKLGRLFEVLSEIFAWGEKALVFTSWNATADRIITGSRERFGPAIMTATLDGRLPIEERQALLDLFSQHRGPAVLVLNPRAGGTGLNITAANHVIHYSPEWNPAVEDQAAARAHRRGQTLPVTVRRLVFAGTVEEVMAERLQRKRRIAETAIVGVEGDEVDRRDILAALNRSPLSGMVRT